MKRSSPCPYYLLPTLLAQLICLESAEVEKAQQCEFPPTAQDAVDQLNDQQEDSFALLQLQVSNHSYPLRPLHISTKQTSSNLRHESYISRSVEVSLTGTTGKNEPPPITLMLLAVVIATIVFYIFYELGIRLVSRMNLPDARKEYLLDAIDITACFAGIVMFLCSTGIAQEYILTQDYGGEKFPSTMFIIMVNRTVVVIIASISILVRKESINLTISKWAAIPSATVLISSWAQYESLHYVTFPTQVAFKSLKIIPTMVLNTVINRKLQQFSDYLLACIIIGCVIGFTMIVEEVSEGIPYNTAIGIILLCLFLTCDALTSTTEKWVYERDNTFTNTQMMFSVGVVTLVYAVISTVSSGSFPIVLRFLSRHQGVIFQLLMIACCSAFGQWVTYYTVRRHGPVALAIMMTARQVISICLSAWLYHHYMPITAALCAAGAFAACLWKPLYRYFAQDQRAGTAKDDKRVST